MEDGMIWSSRIVSFYGWKVCKTTDRAARHTRNGIVVAKDLDVLPIPWAPRVRSKDSIERQVLQVHA